MLAYFWPLYQYAVRDVCLCIELIEGVGEEVDVPWPASDHRVLWRVLVSDAEMDEEMQRDSVSSFCWVYYSAKNAIGK